MTPTSLQVLLREESTPGKPALARREATHDVKRREASVRAGRLSPETGLSLGEPTVLPLPARPRWKSDKRGPGLSTLPGVEEFGAYASVSCREPGELGVASPQWCVAGNRGKVTNRKPRR
jgi:hypothetical protein